MPELSFVLPHWLYWGGLVVFPLVTLLLYRRARAGTRSARNQTTAPAYSLVLGYVLWLIGGFMGIHRMYLKSQWAWLFVVLFTSILLVNVQIRDARNTLSTANNEIKTAQYKINSAQKALAKGRSGAQKRLDIAQQRLQKAEVAQSTSQQAHAHWKLTARILGGAILFALLVDLFLLPGLVRRRNRQLDEDPPEGFVCPAVGKAYKAEHEPFLFNRLVSRLNGWTGELVAYWSLIAVLVYYYEVMARYVFNSPTNWAHESMFLMFGMQYLLAGGFVLREGAHVRVDVLYMHFSTRMKAIVDLITSVFFFIFVFTLLLTGWIFFMDSYKVNEVSFTEWGIQYWPIKIALPLGALLLLLQGIAVLIKDAAAVFRPNHTPSTIKAEG